VSSRHANSTEYGLAGSIWSTDTEHALALSKRIATGIVALNGFGWQFNTPFGGVKSSGLGREMGPESLEAYTEYQSVLLPCAGWSGDRRVYERSGRNGVVGDGPRAGSRGHHEEINRRRSDALLS
jgi:hypothetical protein